MFWKSRIWTKTCSTSNYTLRQKILASYSNFVASSASSHFIFYLLIFFLASLVICSAAYSSSETYKWSISMRAYTMFCSSWNHILCRTSVLLMLPTLQATPASVTLDVSACSSTKTVFGTHCHTNVVKISFEFWILKYIHILNIFSLDKSMNLGFLLFKKRLLLLVRIFFTTDDFIGVYNKLQNFRSKSVLQSMVC